jgi:rhodanese-related sulfurtransferase
MQVAAYLSSQGFTHLANIAGGIHAWSSEVDPTVPTY